MPEPGAAAAVEPFLAAVYQRCGLNLAMVTPWKKLGEAGFGFGSHYFWHGGRDENILWATLGVRTIWGCIRKYKLTHSVAPYD